MKIVFWKLLAINNKLENNYLSLVYPTYCTDLFIIDKKCFILVRSLVVINTLVFNYKDIKA